MVFKTLLVVLVLAVLMEDSVSIKKTAEEKKEDEELAERVNATLAAEEEKKRKEEENAAKKKKKIEVVKIESGEEKKEGRSQDEACPPVNSSCPIMKPCQPCEDCPQCPDCPQCGQCPEIQPCDPCGPCPPVKPCKPCEQVSPTDLPPTNNTCPEGPGMSVPMALAVGACAGGLLTGVAALLGLLLRYFSPLECGFVFLATIIIVWYLCSHYPDTARELGARAATLLREAATALGHRVMEAIQRHQEQVGVPVLIPSFLLPDLSSVFI
jgi:hypothetical protein